MARPPDGARTALVVGAGLSGAAFAWLAARRGLQTVLVAGGRPAARDDAVDSPIVHGLGPPSPPRTWLHAGEPLLRRAADRAERGRRALETALLCGSRSSGLRSFRHALMLPAALGHDAVRTLHGRLRAAGFRLALDGRELVNDDDALVHPRRLALELLRQARAAGAELRFGAPLPRAARETPAGVSLALDGEPRSFDTVLWTVARDPPGAARDLGDGRVVVRERMFPGRVPLGTVLSSFDGAAQIAPDAWRGGGTLLLRSASARADGHAEWPRVPAAWSPYVGPVRRRSLALVPDERKDAALAVRGRILAFRHLFLRPVAPLLGACEEIVARLAGLS